MRGQQSFYAIFFTEENKAVVKDQNRPRNPYMPDRNNVLAHRWYFYAVIKNYNQPRCMKELEREFFLTSARIEVILAEIQPLLREINVTRPTAKQLDKMFPWLNWIMA